MSLICYIQGMSEASEGNDASKEAEEILGSEENKYRTVSLPYKTAEFLRTDLEIRHSGRGRQWAGIPPEPPDSFLSILKERFQAIDMSPRFLGTHFLQRAPVKMSYHEIDVYGKLVLQEGIKLGAALSEDQQPKPANPRISMLQEAMDNTIDELGKVTGQDLSMKGIFRGSLKRFARNFLVLNHAFVVAGGKDNAPLRETYEKVVKSSKVA